jgi:transketolase
VRMVLDMRFTPRVGAARYAPDEMKAIRETLASAQALVAKQDYKGALEAARAIPEKVKAALDLSEARRSRLEEAWNNAAASVEKDLVGLGKRIDSLAAARKLPRGLDKKAIEAAQETMASLDVAWKRAVEQAKDGDYPVAIPAAMGVKNKAEALLDTLGGK